MSEVFKNRLQEALTLRGMSAAELSRRCGIDKSAICRYLKGKTGPRPDAVSTISAALGVSPAWLLGFDDKSHATEAKQIYTKDYNPIDYSKLSKKNKIRIVAYYQALLDTQEKNS